MRLCELDPRIEEVWGCEQGIERMRGAWKESEEDLCRGVECVPFRPSGAVEEDCKDGEGRGCYCDVIAQDADGREIRGFPGEERFWLHGDRKYCRVDLYLR